MQQDELFTMRVTLDTDKPIDSEFLENVVTAELEGTSIILGEGKSAVIDRVELWSRPIEETPDGQAEDR